MFQFVKVKDNVKSKLKKKDDVKSKLSFDHFEIFCKAKNLAEIGLKTGGDTFGQKWPIFVHKKKNIDIYLTRKLVLAHENKNSKVPLNLSFGSEKGRKGRKNRQ